MLPRFPNRKSVSSGRDNVRVRECIMVGFCPVMVAWWLSYPISARRSPILTSAHRKSLDYLRDLPIRLKTVVN